MVLCIAIRFVIDSFDGNEGDSKAYRQSLLHVRSDCLLA